MRQTIARTEYKGYRILVHSLRAGYCRTWTYTIHDGTGRSSAERDGGYSVGSALALARRTIDRS